MAVGPLQPCVARGPALRREVEVLQMFAGAALRDRPCMAAAVLQPCAASAAMHPLRWCGECGYDSRSQRVREIKCRGGSAHGCGGSFGGLLQD